MLLPAPGLHWTPDLFANAIKYTVTVNARQKCDAWSSRPRRSLPVVLSPASSTHLNMNIFPFLSFIAPKYKSLKLFILLVYPLPPFMALQYARQPEQKWLANAILPVTHPFSDITPVTTNKLPQQQDDTPSTYLTVLPQRPLRGSTLAFVPSDSL